MKVKQIIFSEDVIDIKTDQAGLEVKNEAPKMAIVNPTLSFMPPFIPTTFSFSAVIMMQGAPKDNTAIKIELVNETNHKTLFSVISNIPGNIQRNTSIPDDFAGLNMNVPLKNIPLETEGSYLFNIYLNDEPSFSEELKIFKNNMK